MISEEMCTTIKTLFEKGYNISQIARMLNIDRKTVRKKLNETNKPSEEKTRISILDPYKEYIEIEAQKGIQAKRIFHDLIRDYGYSGSYDTVKKYIHDLKQTKVSVKVLASFINSKIVIKYPYKDSGVTSFVGQLPLINSN